MSARVRPMRDLCGCAAVWLCAPIPVCFVPHPCAHHARGHLRSHQPQCIEPSAEAKPRSAPRLVSLPRARSRTTACTYLLGDIVPGAGTGRGSGDAVRVVDVALLADADIPDHILHALALEVGHVLRPYTIFSMQLAMATAGGWGGRCERVSRRRGKTKCASLG